MAICVCGGNCGMSRSNLGGMQGMAIARTHTRPTSGYVVALDLAGEHRDCLVSISVGSTKCTESQNGWQMIQLSCTLTGLDARAHLQGNTYVISPSDSSELKPHLPKAREWSSMRHVLSRDLKRAGCSAEEVHDQSPWSWSVREAPGREEAEWISEEHEQLGTADVCS